jgi:predicted secreted acid phosphatase
MAFLKPGMLAGASYKETFEVEVNGEKYEVELRALKHSEVAKIQQIQFAGMKGIAGKAMDAVEVDLGDTIYNNSAAMLEAATAGLGSDWTKKAVEEELTPEVINAIGKRVMTISGLGDPEDVARFREGRSGSK